MEEHEVESVYIKDEQGVFNEYVTIEAYANINGMSRQAVYFKARYENMPGRLEYVRIKKMYLIKLNQENVDLEQEDEDVRVETSNTVVAE